MPGSDRIKSQSIIMKLFGKTDSYLRLMRLNRPIGIWLLLWPTLWALWISADGSPTPAVFVVFVLGTVVMRSAGCVINDFADRKLDAHVRRTADRPLANREIAPVSALLLFAVLMGAALALVTRMNTLTLLLAFAAAAITVIYPFMKRFIAAPQLVLGIAFAWGVPMAYAAETGEVSRDAWLLALCTVIWVLVYDTQYAMADRDDDLKLGIQSTAILFGEMDVTIVVVLQCVLIGGLWLVGNSAELGSWFNAGLVAAGFFALRQFFLIRHREPLDCHRAFLNNAWFGAAVFAGIVLDYIFRLG